MTYIISGQTLPEGSPDRSTVCQGTDLVGNCLNTDRIAVKSVQYGTKLTTTCSLSNTSAGCCNFDATDCLIDYTGTLQQESCSGKAVCNSVTISAADSTSCGATNYPILNHYLTIEFYCVSGKSHCNFIMYITSPIYIQKSYRIPIIISMHLQAQRKSALNLTSSLEVLRILLI